jgi:hypothetical protein
MIEISTLVEALEREPYTIKAWATRNYGVVSAKAEDTCMHEQDTESYLQPRIVMKGKARLIIQ